MAITKYSGKIPQDLKLVADLPKGWPGNASVEEGSDSYRIHVDRYYHVPEYAKLPHPITNREELLAKYFVHDRDYGESLLAEEPVSFLNEVEVRKVVGLFETWRSEVEAECKDVDGVELAPIYDDDGYVWAEINMTLPKDLESDDAKRKMSIISSFIEVYSR